MSQSTGAASQPPAGIGAVDRYFKISERGSTVAREVRGGLVSFFAMAYIVVLNPIILTAAADVRTPPDPRRARRCARASAGDVPDHHRGR